ncbi:MAG: DUF1800 family protein [Acidimicrobiales bacterium]
MAAQVPTDTPSETPTDTAAVAHLLRRTTFGPAPGRLAELADHGYDAVLDAVLGRSDPSTFGPVFAAPVLDVPDIDAADDTDDLIFWWFDRMADPLAGLHEKLVWFWHDHFTSSVDKCSGPALVAQHRTVRRLALGNFRELVRAMVHDAAMLQYLDAAGSDGMAPNENLARELMELFTLGRGTYAQADVVAAARALAGRWVDWETAAVEVDDSRRYPGMLEFLGVRGRLGPDDIADIICAQPACAPFVARKLHGYLVGTDPDGERLDALAEVFVAADLEIAPLVEAIVDSETFRTAIRTRPRFGLEWYVAAANAIGLGPMTEDRAWHLYVVDQWPFRPPNVAGWGVGERWLSPSQMLARTNLVFDMFGWEPAPLRFDPAHVIADAMAHCGLPDPSASTLAALDAAYWAPLDEDTVNRLAVQILLTSPEFALA